MLVTIGETMVCQKALPPLPTPSACQRIAPGHCQEKERHKDNAAGARSILEAIAQITIIIIIYYILIIIMVIKIMIIIIITITITIIIIIYYTIQ